MSDHDAMLADCLRRVCGKRDTLPLLPNRDQLRANAFGIELALRWAQAGARGPQSNFYVYATNHLMRRSGRSRFGFLPAATRRELSSRLLNQEFLTDVFVTRRSKTATRVVETPIVAAEVEAHANQTVAFNYDHRGYLWDFSKLLYVRAPRRLFIAQLPAARIPALCKTLGLGFRDAPHDDAAVTWAVVLPAANRDIAAARTAVSVGSELLRFRPAFAAAQ